MQKLFSFEENKLKELRVFLRKKSKRLQWLQKCLNLWFFPFFSFCSYGSDRESNKERIVIFHNKSVIKAVVSKRLLWKYFIDLRINL